MKKLLAILLALALLAGCAAALAEKDGELLLGYVAPYEDESGRASQTAKAFAYAAVMQGVATAVVRYEEAAPAQDGAEAADPAAMALARVVEAGADGVIVVPTSRAQAVALIEQANEAGIPIVIEGMDVSAAYPETQKADGAEEPPYLACVGYGGTAAYAAARWLEVNAPSPLMAHCALPESDPDIESGLRRALQETDYLSMEIELNADANSFDAGYDMIAKLVDNYVMFYCVLADSEALAEGCAAGIRDNSINGAVAAIAHSDEAQLLLDEGSASMIAGTPASVEGIWAFRVLHNYLTEGLVPDGATRWVELAPATATVNDRSNWVDSDDYETAYDLVYPNGDFQQVDSVYGVSADRKTRMGTALAKIAQSMGVGVVISGSQQILPSGDYGVLQALTPVERPFVILDLMGSGDEVAPAVTELGIEPSMELRALLASLAERVSALNQSEWAQLEALFEKYFPVVTVNGENLLQFTLDAPGAEVAHVRASFVQVGDEWVLAQLETTDRD